MALPKVLIINQPFNYNTGGGITLSNLFSGWDKNKLAVACSGYLLNNNVNMEICTNYYQLGFKERKWVFPLKYLKRKYYSGIIKCDAKSFADTLKTKSKFRRKVIMDYAYPILDYIGLADGVSKTELSSELCQWLNDFGPDVIYAVAGSREDVLFSIILHSYLKKPLIFHMMDDWPSTIGRRGFFKKFWKRKVDQEFRILLDRSNILMSISDSMAYEYKMRYGKNFITFHNPINIEFWQKHQRDHYELTNSPTILYAGRVGLGINNSLELFAKAIQQVNEELKICIKFILQTQEKPTWKNNYKNVIHNSFVSYNDLPKVFSESDFLLLPYDFSQNSLKFIKYSMPTKAPEYMASGTPIILFAPEATAIAKYAKKHNCAKVITANNLNEIAAELKELIVNKELREQIAQNAIKVAHKNHDSIDVTNHFRKTIISLI